MIELVSDMQISSRHNGTVHWTATTPSVALLTDTVQTPLPAGRTATWRKGVLNQLGQLSLLKPDWNGERGLTPRADILNSAAGLLDEVLRHAPAIAEPYVRPTPNGGILLAWQHANGDEDLEVELETPGVATFVYSGGGAAPFVQGILCGDSRPIQEDDRVFLRLLARFSSL